MYPQTTSATSNPLGASVNVTALVEQFVDHPGRKMLVSSVEFFLSYALVLQFFQVEDPNLRDDEELHYLVRLSWLPLVIGVLVTYGHQLSRQLFPLPENFEANVRNGKMFVWCCSMALLVYDQKMSLKQGPGLEVAIIFCIVDLGRFEMDRWGLIEIEEDHMDKNEIENNDNPSLPITDANAYKTEAIQESDALRYEREQFQQQLDIDSYTHGPQYQYGNTNYNTHGQHANPMKGTYVREARPDRSIDHRNERMHTDGGFV